jgi:DNA-binding MarR family transcriptional regulator
MPVVTVPNREECNCFAVRAAARHVTQFYDQVLAPAGLRVTQFSILARLKRLGPLTINTLARDMVMDRTTLGRNILPLERDGLIRIEATASDRRAKELHLTKAGEKRLQAAGKGWSEAQARFETTFGPRRAADLRTMLRAVVASEFPPRAQFPFLLRMQSNHWNGPPN